jgi:hypothetical protein
MRCKIPFERKDQLNNWRGLSVEIAVEEIGQSLNEILIKSKKKASNSTKGKRDDASINKNSHNPNKTNEIK